jgi:Fic family protein
MIFDAPAMTKAIADTIALLDETRKRLRYATSSERRWNGLLRRNTVALNIRGSNSIEGYLVSGADAVAAVQGAPPMDADPDRDHWRATLGYNEAMTYVLQLADDPSSPFNEGTLKSLHFMMLKHDLPKNPGRWRPGYIAIRDEARGEIVYEAPDAEEVPKLIGELIESLNSPDTSVPITVRAALAHLNLAMIHPFSDGNGRMARCLQTLVLVREGILGREFCSVEEFTGVYSQDYYRALASVGGARWNPHKDTESWVSFMLQLHCLQAAALLKRTEAVRGLWDRLEAELKRLGLPNSERLILALHDAAAGIPVRNATYRRTADNITENQASRDLRLLVDAHLLVAKGRNRGRYYVAGGIVAELGREYKEAAVLRVPISLSLPSSP